MPLAPLDAFAVSPPGLEALVAHELRVLGIAGATPRTVTGGVECRVDAEGLAALLLHLRVASGVLVRLAQFRATAFHELERAARKVEWGRVLPDGAPFQLRVTCRKSRLYHSDAVAERVAAAIVRAVPGAVWAGSAEDDEAADPGDVESPAGPPTAAERAAEGEPPRPPQRFVVRVDHDRCTVSADAAGTLLHRRGYRRAVAKAPLRENLAAAMLLGAAWDPATPLVDPMCGSGTIAIEAALLARCIAPGLARDFAAEAWPVIPATAFARMREAARARILPRAAVPIVAGDRDAGAIAAARANAERAGVLADIDFRVATVSALHPPDGTGLVLANPPYGIRVGETAPLRDLFARLGQVLRARCLGWRVALLSADRSLDAQLRLAWTDRFTTRNGGIAVHLAEATVTDAAPAPPRTRSRRPG